MDNCYLLIVLRIFDLMICFLTPFWCCALFIQIMLADQDLTALSDHAQRLMDLVVNTVAQKNSNANTSLTILSTIFLPLTFIAGEGGMKELWGVGMRELDRLRERERWALLWREGSCMR